MVHSVPLACRKPPMNTALLLLRQIPSKLCYDSTFGSSLASYYDEWDELALLDRVVRRTHTTYPMGSILLFGIPPDATPTFYTDYLPNARDEE